MYHFFADLIYEENKRTKLRRMMQND
jgi:hypothetical protein